MRSKPRIQGTFRGAGATPRCETCKHNRHVVRLFVGKGQKVWVCSEHFKIKGKMKPQTFKERLLKKAPQAEEHSLASVLPNRYARRRHGYGEARVGR